MVETNLKARKRTRKGGPRGKTGCPTCRARHVKCDERRPSCLNCTSTGRKCDRYDSTRAPRPQQSLLPLDLARLCTSRTSPWNDSQVALAHTLGPSSNEQGNRFFHSFLYGCVPSLTESMDSDFWQRGILRASSSPAVQDAAIALGAVYEERMSREHHHALSLNVKKLELLSSIQYAAAIQTLQRRILQMFRTPEILEEIMTACLMFIFMEILREDDVAAVTHLDAAIKLHSYSRPSDQPFINGQENKAASSTDIELARLTNTFLRLDIQSVLYMGSRTPWDPVGEPVRFQMSENIPATFKTFLEARDTLYAHLACIMNFLTPPEGAEKCFPGWCPHPERGFDIYTIFHGSTYRDFSLPKVGTQRRHFMQVLSRWKSAFQAFLHEGTAKTPEALAACALLWMAYYTTRIKLSVSYTEDECSYDEQLPSFKKIVDQAEAYLKYTGFQSLKRKKADFRVYSTVCHPLYYTALKCRFKPLRQLALEMLRNADNDGIWDADMLAKIAEFVIAAEEYSTESDFYDYDAPQFGVPEKNRIHCLSLNIDKAQRIVWLRYNRRALTAQGGMVQSRDPLQRWIIGDTNFTWKDTAVHSTTTMSIP